jgi:hypothetical protein
VRFLLQLLGGISLTFLVLAGGAYAFPGMLGELGINPVEISHLYQRLDEQQMLSEKLEARLQEIADRSETKDRIVKDLFAGKLTLLDAAALFRDLPGTDQVCWQNALFFEKGNTFDERICSYTVGWARDWLSRTTSLPPAQQAAIITSLQGKLSEHLEAYGTIELPGKKD